MKVVKRIQEVFFNIKIQKQLYLIYLSAILLSILLVSSFLVYNTYHLMLNHYNEQADADNLRVKSILYDLTTSVYNLSDDIFSDEELQNILSTRYATKEDSIKSSQNYQIFDNYLKDTPAISSITVYTTNPTMGASSDFIPVTEDIEGTDWYQKASNQMDVLWYSGPVTDTWHKTYQDLQLIRKIPILSTNEYAVLVISISNDYLKNRIRNENYKTVITVDQEPIFYSSDRNFRGQTLFIPLDYTKSYFRYTDRITYLDKPCIAALSTFTPLICDDILYIITIDVHGWNNIIHLTLTCLLIGLLAVLIPLFFVIVFANIFNSRITTLRQEMHKVSLGDYDIIESFYGDDEIAALFTDLKTMITSIKKMDAEIYEGTLNKHQLINQQQKMEFAMLTSQINPHFLFNTLESIRMKAFIEGNKDVANAIMMLGKSMHYVLENNRSSSTILKKELDYIVIYLSIQKLRFGDRINYSMSIDPTLDIEEYEILPLLIQPIVENSILHGLEETETGGKIRITIKKTIMTVCIEIYDNGCGMSQEQLMHLNKTVRDNKKGSSTNIGLRNIYQRIQLFYGSDYDLLIESEEGTSTTVTLILPVQPIKEVC